MPASTLLPMSRKSIPAAREVGAAERGGARMRRPRSAGLARRTVLRGCLAAFFFPVFLLPAREPYLLREAGGAPAGSDPQGLTPGGGKLYSRGFAPEYSRNKLWLTDGTEAGTRLLADIYPGSGGSWPSSFTVAGDRLYFVAEDRDPTRRLWAITVGSPEEPWAFFAATSACKRGGKVLLDGTRSFGGAGAAIVRYEWRIGAAALTGAKAEYELPEDLSAPLEVCLSVTNDKGFSDTACRLICFAYRFRRGDANGDGKINLSDAVAIAHYLFLGGSLDCLDAADADDDGLVILTDAIMILNYLFRAGRELPAPWPDCGVDRSEDELGCAYYPECP